MLSYSCFYAALFLPSKYKAGGVMSGVFPINDKDPISLEYVKVQTAYLLIHQSGAEEFLVCPRGEEPFKISKTTYDIVFTILKAKSHEHIEPVNDDPETNLQYMEAGL
jgi:hypothetical protein